jgi:hypothetical protein
LYKIGRSGGRRRARQRAERRDSEGPSLWSVSGSQGSPPDPRSVHDSNDRRWPIHEIVAGLWIVLSIVLIGYATIEGEAALADLDGLDLVATYAWEPIDDSRR